MKFEELLSQVELVINTHGGYWSKPWLLSATIEELGEFSKELQIDAGLHPNRTTTNEKLEEEYGDLLFTVLALGKGLNINVGKAIMNTIEKYLERGKNKT